MLQLLGDFVPDHLSGLFPWTPLGHFRPPYGQYAAVHACSSFQCDSMGFFPCQVHQLKLLLESGAPRSRLVDLPPFLLPSAGIQIIA